jgi:hypothetical protein
MIFRKVSFNHFFANQTAISAEVSRNQSRHDSDSKQPNYGVNVVESLRLDNCGLHRERIAF